MIIYELKRVDGSTKTIAKLQVTDTRTDDMLKVKSNLPSLWDLGEEAVNFQTMAKAGMGKSTRELQRDVQGIC